VKHACAIRKAVGIFAGAREVIRRDSVVIPRRHLRTFWDEEVSAEELKREKEDDCERAREKAAAAEEEERAVAALEKSSADRPVIFRSMQALPDSLRRHVSCTQLQSSVCAVFRDRLYELHGPLTDDEFALLTWRESEREQKFFARIRERQERTVRPAADPRTTIPTAVRREVWNRDGARCVECGSTADLEYDHLIPVSRGGSSTVRNIRLLCEACNRRKGDSF
jgi:hypothetical protein